MRLDFRILWVDDQPRHIDSFEENLKNKLIDSGFKLEVVRATSLDEVSQYIHDHVHDDRIDLVLVDYDLGDGTGGELILETIRCRFPFKDVIFYSGGDIVELRRIAFDKQIDGIHFSSRLSLVDDTLEVIKNLLRKVLDLDHMRGIAMAATSDIDFIVESILTELHGQLDENKQNEFLAEIFTRLDKKLKRYSEDLRKAKEKNTFKALLALRPVYTSHDKLVHLVEKLKDGLQNQQIYEKAKSYSENVVPQRNKLAHAIIYTLENGQTVLRGNSEGHTFSKDDMTSLRKELIEHRRNFHDIAVWFDIDFD